ncbi:MAG: ribonuclease HI [Gammaproteobacteria bacterium]|jgi:ribonuclease HI
MKEIRVFTDGACRGNPGPGGWGVVLKFQDHVRELSGGELNTTNNRMELTAAIRALESLEERYRVQLFTDSTYVKDGITKWLPNWRERGWRTASKKSVKNQDLWAILAGLVEQQEVFWHWVKGHAGNPGNERADALANQGLDKCLY